MLPLAINAHAAVRTTDPRLIKVAASFSASDWRLFRTIILPSAIPFLLAGLRLAVGRGMIGVVVGEIYGSAAGIGAMISQAGSRFQTDKVFVGVLTIVAIGVTLVEIVRRIERQRRRLASAVLTECNAPCTPSSKRRTSGWSISSLAPTTRLMALGGVNLTIMDGEFVSIVGPSGCGKTTFLSVVDGLIAATSGRILVDGKEVTKPGPDRAVVFQDASLLPWRTVLRNVLYGLECLGVKTREAQGTRGAFHRDGRAVRLRASLSL